MNLSDLVGGRVPDYIRLSDTKDSGTAGTTYTASAYRKVTINTVDIDDGSPGNCTLNDTTNKFTLTAGTYQIKITFKQPINATGDLTVRLRNTTNTSTVLKWPAVGVSNRNTSGPTGEYNGNCEGRFVIGASKELEVQVNATVTCSQAASSDIENEVYWVVELWKLK